MVRNLYDVLVEATNTKDDTQAINNLVDLFRGVVNFIQDKRLKSLRDSRIEDLLLQIFQTASYPVDARKRAIRVSVQIGSSKVVELLFKAAHDEDSQIRIAAIEGLARIGWKNPVFELLLSMLSDENAEIRRAVIWALRERDDTRAVEPILQLLENEEDEGVRITAAETLGDLTGNEDFSYEISENIDNRAVPTLIRFLKDNSFDVRYDTVISLRRIGDRAAIEPLIEAIRDEDPQIRYQIIKTLEYFGAESAIPALNWLAKHDPDKTYGRYEMDEKEVYIKDIALKAVENILNKTK